MDSWRKASEEISHHRGTEDTERIGPDGRNAGHHGEKSEQSRDGKGSQHGSQAEALAGVPRRVVHDRRIRIPSLHPRPEYARMGNALQGFPCTRYHSLCMLRALVRCHPINECQAQGPSASLSAVHGIVRWCGPLAQAGSTVPGIRLHPATVRAWCVVGDQSGPSYSASHQWQQGECTPLLARCVARCCLVPIRVVGHSAAAERVGPRPAQIRHAERSAH